MVVPAAAFVYHRCMATDLLALTYPSAEFLRLLLNREGTQWGDSIRDAAAIKASTRMDFYIWQDQMEQAAKAASTPPCIVCGGSGVRCCEFGADR